MDEREIKLIEQVAVLANRIDSIATSFTAMQEHVMRLESLREQDIHQNERIESILMRLQQGNGHFEKIDRRLEALERSEGERARGIIGKAASYVFIAFLSAILSNLHGIIHAIGQ